MGSLSPFTGQERRLQGHQVGRAGTQICASRFPAWCFTLLASPLPSCLSSHLLPSMNVCVLNAEPLQGLWQSLSWVKSPCGCVGTKTRGGEETSAEKCNPDLMGPATPWACELSAVEENRATNCSVGLGCIWRMVVRPEQTSLSADLFSG